jgi:hypothetical protein
LHARALKKLFIYDVKHVCSLENFASVVHFDVFRDTDLERISNLTKLQKLVIVECPKMKVLEGLAALQRLSLEDYDMQTVPRYLQDVKPRLMLLDCSLPLLTSIAAGKHGPEWDKFSHIHQVKAYADDEGIPRKKYMLYTRDPFRFETNISFSAIARRKLKLLLLHLIYFIFQILCYSVMLALISCFLPVEADGIAPSSDQWTEAAVYSACTQLVGGRYSRQQR